jgi:hypothetical protein
MILLQHLQHQSLDRYAFYLQSLHSLSFIKHFLSMYTKLIISFTSKKYKKKIVFKLEFQLFDMKQDKFHILSRFT